MLVGAQTEGEVTTAIMADDPQRGRSDCAHECSPPSSLTVEPDRSPRTGTWRPLVHPPAANPLGSRWRRGGVPPASISLRSDNSRLRRLPCARGGSAVKQNTWSAPGVTPPSEVRNGRKRRGSVTRRRCGDGYYNIAEAPPVERVGESKRASASNRDHGRVSEVIRKRVHVLRAAGLTLREISALAGISHEAVRSVLREPETALAVN